ncbi:hypothetical protein U0070_014118 [Myodes glareolus]|uniref:Uncharacterized protein n=1 Tax=Myodes glareolus TaxID=447135 RepID=A0AAW0JDE2_MYOGA
MLFKQCQFLNLDFTYPSGRLAVCQSYSDLPWGGLYTNIFSDWPNPVILGTFTPFGCGSISCPRSSRKGAKEGIKVPAKLEVGQRIRRAEKETHPFLVHGSHSSVLPAEEVWEALFPDINSASQDAKEMLATYKKKCRMQEFMSQIRDASKLADPVDTDPDDPGADISLMHDLATSIELIRIQKKVKHILLHWLNYYRSTLGLESPHVCRLPPFAKKAVRKPKVSFAIPALTQSAKEVDWYKEYLRYRNNFLTLKEFFKPSPYHYIHRTSTVSPYSRFSLLAKGKDLWFSSQLACPVVLRKTMCGEDGNICRCSCHTIPEVTDLEYDHLIGKQLSRTDQIIVVCVSSAEREDKTIEEVTDLYKEMNKSRNMPCIQSHLDSFRLLKYDVTSASKFMKPGCPLLVRRHNLTPGIFLVCV